MTQSMACSRNHNAYAEYSRLWDQPIAGTSHEGNLGWYFAEAYKAFASTKAAVQDLMAINDNAMYQTASSLKNMAHRAVMPGIIAIVSALVLSLFFSYFVNIYIVNPWLFPALWPQWAMWDPGLARSVPFRAEPGPVKRHSGFSPLRS
jgi:hypothetical protein